MHLIVYLILEWKMLVVTKGERHDVALLNFSARKIEGDTSQWMGNPEHHHKLKLFIYKLLMNIALKVNRRCEAYGYISEKQ